MVYLILFAFLFVYICVHVLYLRLCLYICVHVVCLRIYVCVIDCMFMPEICMQHMSMHFVYLRIRCCRVCAYHDYRQRNMRGLY